MDEEIYQEDIEEQELIPESIVESPQEEDVPIKVYIQVNENNEITSVNSDIFISDFTSWLLIDKGSGDKFAHAQSNYFPMPLIDENGAYNYKYVNGIIVEVSDEDKPKYVPYTYSELVEKKIRLRYTVSDELAILRQRDTKPSEFSEYNEFCEQCKIEARKELGI